MLTRSYRLRAVTHSCNNCVPNHGPSGRAHYGFWTSVRDVVFTNKKETDLALRNQTGEHKALVQRAAVRQFRGGSGWRNKLARLVPLQRTMEYNTALVYAEQLQTRAQSPHFRGTSLPNSFATWLRISFVYLWLLETRCRRVSNLKSGQRMIQKCLDYLWEDLEISLVEVLDTKNPLVITKHSKGLSHTWLGAAMAYDVEMLAPLKRYVLFYAALER